jgi:small subunit ribosomal protein S5
MPERIEEEKEFAEKVVQIRRVTKVVKGGKKMGFRAAVVVGNHLGRVGFGLGKSAEVSAAIRKAVESAKKRLISVKMIGTTIPHETEGRMGSSYVLIRPTQKGTGVIAGGAIRSVLELVGIKDVVAKSLGSPNSINTARATINALLSLRDKDEEEELRAKELRVYYIQKEE